MTNHGIVFKYVVVMSVVSNFGSASAALDTNTVIKDLDTPWESSLLDRNDKGTGCDR
jgi:hypothetical protein